MSTTAIVHAQPTGGGLIIGDEAETNIPNATAVTGSTIELPILLVGDEPVQTVAMTVMTNPAELQVLDLQLSAGLMEFIDDGGMLPTCDIMVEPTGGGAFLFMFMSPMYDPTVYGSEYMVLTIAVNGAADTIAEIQYTNFSGVDSATVTITAEGETPFMRGDTNNDAACDITDAVRVLEVLFQGGSLDCPDAADLDDNGQLEVTDAVLLLGALFQGSPAIDETCGSDTTDDGLSECTSAACP